VPGREEVRLVFASPGGGPRLGWSLPYGAGLRLSGVLRLRVKGVGFPRQEVLARDGKGRRGRPPRLPAAVWAPLPAHLGVVRRLRERDLGRGPGRAPPPDALARQCPAADRPWGWQWASPASPHYVDRRTGARHRHPVQGPVAQQAVQEAVRGAGQAKPAGCHTFRHCFTTHLPEDGYDVRAAQELLGHKDVGTSMVYTHLLNGGGKGVHSPLGRPWRFACQPIPATQAVSTETSQTRREPCRRTSPTNPARNRPGSRRTAKDEPPGRSGGRI
jgi:integrase